MLEHGLQQEVQGLLQLAADTQDEDSLRRSNDPEIQKILADSPPGRINIEALEDYIDSRLDQVDRKLSHAESNPHSFASESRHKAELATRQTGDAAAISRAPRPPEIHTSALEQRLNDLRERIAAGNNPRDLQIFERIVQNMSEESERFLEDTHDIFDNIVKLERPLVVELDGVHKDLLSIYAEITKADNPHGSAARVTGRIGKAISVYDRIKSIGGLILADSAAERFGRGAEIIANIAGSPFGPMYAAAVEQAEIFAESFQSRQDMLDLMSLASKYLDGDITDTLNVLVPYQRAKK